MKNAKEKAKELYFKMMQHSFGGDSEQSKQCALIAVDEILLIKKEIWDDFHSEYFDYWKEVKQEIENL